MDENLQQLKAEYIAQLAPIRARRERLQATLQSYRGEAYIRVSKRIGGLYACEQNLIDAITRIQRSIDGRWRSYD